MLFFAATDIQARALSPPIIMQRQCIAIARALEGTAVTTLFRTFNENPGLMHLRVVQQETLWFCSGPDKSIRQRFISATVIINNSSSSVSLNLLFCCRFLPISQQLFVAYVTATRWLHALCGAVALHRCILARSRFVFTRVISLNNTGSKICTVAMATGSVCPYGDTIQ